MKKQKNNCRKWNKKRLSHLKKLLKTNLSRKEIAEILELTPSRITEVKNKYLKKQRHLPPVKVELWFNRSYELMCRAANLKF